MKLQIINSERKPESVSPKIKIYDTEEDLKNDLDNLNEGAIVATKEDESSYWKTIEATLKIIVEDKQTVNQNITLYPLGNGIYSFATNYTFGKQEWKQPYQLFDFAVDGFDFITLDMSVTQYEIGPLTTSVVLSAKRGYAVITNTEKSVVLNVSGLLKRGN